MTSVPGVFRATPDAGLAFDIGGAGGSAPFCFLAEVDRGLWGSPGGGTKSEAGKRPKCRSEMGARRMDLGDTGKCVGIALLACKYYIGAALVCQCCHDSCSAVQMPYQRSASVVPSHFPYSENEHVFRFPGTAPFPIQSSSYQRSASVAQAR